MTRGGEPIAAVALLGAFSVLGYQAFLFLREGFWTPISLLSLLSPAKLAGWPGLVLILDFIPLSATLFCVAIVVALEE